MSKNVWTPSGYQRGPKNSLVGKGESIIDYHNGTGTLVTKGKRGVDNQPSSVSENDNNVIAGNDIDWKTGYKFSDQAAPFTARLQQFNKITDQYKDDSKAKYSSLSKQTKDLQFKNLDAVRQPILDQLKEITDRQKNQHDTEKRMYDSGMYTKGKDGIPQYNCGKYNCGKFNCGKYNCGKPKYYNGLDYQLDSNNNMIGYNPGLGSNTSAYAGDQYNYANKQHGVLGNTFNLYPNFNQDSVNRYWLTNKGDNRLQNWANQNVDRIQNKGTQNTHFFTLPNGQTVIVNEQGQVSRRPQFASAVSSQKPYNFLGNSIASQKPNISNVPITGINASPSLRDRLNGLYGKLKGLRGIPLDTEGLDLAAGSVIPMAMEAGMLNRWASSNPKGSNVYAANPYEGIGLDTLSKMKMNPYTQIKAQDDAERRAVYGLSQAGGLTGAQRYSGRVAMALDNMRNAGTAYKNAELQNNQYAQNFAENALKYGDSDAQRRQSANIYDYDTYAKAHGAKVRGIETHTAGLGAQIQKYFANRIKNRQYRDLLSLYQQDMGEKQREFNLNLANR